MKPTQGTRKSAHQRDYYEIRLKGHLAERWSNGFDGLAINHQSDGTTLLAGALADQAALHGVFNRIRDLGLSIVSVQSVKTD